MRSLLAEIRGNFSTVPSIVCNAAGIICDNSLLKMNEKSWDDVMDVNLKVVFIPHFHQPM